VICPRFATAFVELRRVKAAHLIPNPENWRTHPAGQAAALRSILEEVGVADALLARETPQGLVLIDGHLRRELDPEAELPVLVLDVNEDEARLLLATLDPLAAMAGTDGDRLAALLSEIAITDDGLAAHLASYNPTSAVGLTDPDEVPEIPAEPITKPGELWLLGDHRLLCGDSTRADDLAGLMGGVMADLVFTDPPYGVGYSGGAKPRTALIADQTGTTIYADALPNLRSAAADHAALYLWYADAHAAAAAAAGYVITAQIIWVKNNAQFVTAAHYAGKHEPCFYAHRKGKTAKWYGPNNEVTVWEVDRAAKNEFHPTQKPVELAARAIANSSEHLDRVLDLFGGSGSTLIAAERTGRTAYLMEIDPAYCDVIVARWEAFTGKEATRG
jgi:DNA modification methylase